MVNEVLNSINNINLIITESMLDVRDSIHDFKNKSQFIDDYNNNTEIPQSYIESFNHIIDGEVIMEADGTTPSANLNKAEYEAYRFDFLQHKSKQGDINRRIGKLLCSAFLASQEAKKQKNEPYNELKNVTIKRTSAMQKIINKLYDGKVEAINEVVKFLDVYSKNKSCFIQVRIIPYGVAQHRNGDTGKFLEVHFNLKLPKQVLTPDKYEICKYIDGINALKKEQRELIKTNGTGDPRVTELATQIAEKHKKAPYGFQTTNSDACKDLKNETCYTSDETKKVLVDYVMAFHCLRNNKSPENVIEMIDNINSRATTGASAELTDDLNNSEQIEALAKQFDIAEEK